eukprot:767689-Hanusia_phi.AAC.2
MPTKKSKTLTKKSEDKDWQQFFKEEMLKDRIQELETANEEYKQENKKILEENRVPPHVINASPDIFFIAVFLQMLLKLLDEERSLCDKMKWDKEASLRSCDEARILLVKQESKEEGLLSRCFPLSPYVRLTSHRLEMLEAAARRMEADFAKSKESLSTENLHLKGGYKNWRKPKKPCKYHLGWSLRYVRRCPGKFDGKDR